MSEKILFLTNEYPKNHHGLKCSQIFLQYKFAYKYKIYINKIFVSLGVYVYDVRTSLIEINFFQGLSLAVRSNDQIPASHWSSPLGCGDGGNDAMPAAGGGGRKVFFKINLFSIIIFFVAKKPLGRRR